MNNGYNIRQWFKLEEGKNQYRYSLPYGDAKWFVTYANAYGGGSAKYEVLKLKHKGEIYDVNSVMFVPSKSEYLRTYQLDSLNKLNTEIYGFLYGSAPDI